MFFTFILMGISIATNLYFIPIFGLSGAALASLITVLLSYAYQQYIVQVKIKTNPFTWAHLRIVIILCTLFALNFLIPSFAGYSPWIDIAIRTSVILGLAGCLIYVMHISPQITWFINKYILRKEC